MGRLTGKVAFVTGAARGQGRSHAIELAREGADVIAFDIAAHPAELDLGYKLGSAVELAETVSQIEALDRRVVSGHVDVRDAAALDDALGKAVAELGRLDIVCANAGIGAIVSAVHETSEEAWANTLDINLTGVWKTCKVAVPHLLASGAGGSIIITSSMASLKTYQGISAYTAAKHGVVGLMKVLAAELGPHGIRVNSIHPTQVRTAMIQNDATYKIFSPEVDNPTWEDFEPVSAAMHSLPIAVAEPVDISNAVVFLASDSARLITGVPLPIDAGMLVK
ncbi:mycofactocin-coupled SDR family oxidoreductase [Rhodococcoides fascians]|uniref:mycofactocin-coupled SDR family oxidoreductase n=1 Tax=Rhodococcoides fascians TaxID=1828 RepID=UPI002ACD7CD3|nr:mycofactocin-coupled SDR family oxidoreductase [Rhodococcus fascians]WQH28791.1 mycofactocin-coupled SDR family oxidoreductase [Rhodococcus fascians]